MNKKYILFIILAILVVGILGYFWIDYNTKPGKLDDFAKCLKDKGAIFYGAYWCSHCQTQKSLFGKSEKYLPYVECSTPDGNSQLQVCKDNKIESYPTWVFSDGERKVGEVSLQDLAQKTGCVLP